MKKYYFLFLAFLLLFFLIFPLFRLFHRQHLIDYTINNFKISESFYRYNGKYYYDFIVYDEKDVYSFTINYSFGKRKKIIHKIQKYQEGNIVCIQPIYKKDVELDLYCLKDSVQLSGFVLKDDSNYQKIYNSLFKEKIDKNYDEIVEYDKLKVFPHHILKNDVFYLWNYKGIYVIKNSGISYEKILDFDLYDNVMSATVDNYYVLFDNSSVDGIEDIYYYNSKNHRLKKFQLKESLSKDSYINGVRDSFIYVTDRRNKIQYRIQIDKEKIELVGDEENYYVTFKDRDMLLMNKSDFFMKNQLFQDHTGCGNKIEVEDCILENGKYYYREGNQFYKQMLNANKILLFELDNVISWNIVDGEFVLVSEDDLYSFSDFNGLQKIVEYHELLYNYSNIYQLGR